MYPVVPLYMPLSSNLFTKSNSLFFLFYLYCKAVISVKQGTPFDKNCQYNFFSVLVGKAKVIKKG